MQIIKQKGEWHSSPTQASGYPANKNDYKKAWNDYEKAWQIYLFLNEEKLDALHYKMFPDCTWNGETIFSKEK